MNNRIIGAKNSEIRFGKTVVGIEADYGMFRVHFVIAIVVVTVVQEQIVS